MPGKSCVCISILFGTCPCLLLFLPSSLFHINSWDSLYLICSFLNWHYFPYPLTALLSCQIPLLLFTHRLHTEIAGVALFHSIFSYLFPICNLPSVGGVTLASDVKICTCTSAPILCSEHDCQKPWMILRACVCVPAQEALWEGLIEKPAGTCLSKALSVGRWAQTAQASPYSNSQTVCWIPLSTPDRFVMFWIFGNCFRALSVKYMHILKWCYFNLDANKEENMYATVIIISLLSNQ